MTVERTKPGFEKIVPTQSQESFATAFNSDYVDTSTLRWFLEGRSVTCFAFQPLDTLQGGYFQDVKPRVHSRTCISFHCGQNYRWTRTQSSIAKEIFVVLCVLENEIVEHFASAGKSDEIIGGFKGTKVCGQDVQREKAKAGGLGGHTVLC